MPDPITPVAPLLSEAIIDTNDADTVLVAGVAGKIIKVYQLFIVQADDATLTFKSASTALCGALPMLANGSVFMAYTTAPWFTTADGADFVLSQSSTVQVSGRLYYLQLPTPQG